MDDTAGGVHFSGGPSRVARVHWLGNDVRLELLGTPAAPVSITWWRADNGAWAGTRVLSPAELDRLTDAVERVTASSPDEDRTVDLGAVLSMALDH